MIDVECKVLIYEEDDKDLSLGEPRYVRVRSEPVGERVILVIGDHTYSVVANDLKVAVQNALATGRA